MLTRLQKRAFMEAARVYHNKAKSRFEYSMDGSVGVLEYMLAGNNITFTHTEVPQVMGGKGVGSSLVSAGIEYAKDNHLSIDSHCWFVDKYMQKHNISRSPSNL